KRGEGGQRPDEGREFEARTFHRTATRKYETRYWRTIAKLAHGSYINKDNADVVLDDATQKRLKHRRNDLDRLADHLVGYYEKLGVTTGWQPFEWETDFDYPWSEGWRAGGARNIITIIPGRNRKKAVIMADHYDTAYMEDKFGHTGKGPRLAAPGADDNHSATAALMLAAPIFLEQKLEHDIWLVHLTGEEFPADCLGARNLTQAIVERTLRLHRTRGKPLDLSKTEIAGVFVLDMVAHNNRRERDIFQICPGWGRSSMLLAREAHRANMDWNAHAAAMNERGARRSATRGKRSRDPRIVPPLAKHLPLRGEVRPLSDGHSTLYNTDGQIFSDAGIPVVLFMENYDINRHGYHDSKDTMENIDLDYGAALTAIAIETVCRSAQSTNPTDRSSKKSSTTPATSRPRKSKRRWS
ncbi:MAG: M28 family metallopeptidase, partial [Thermoanaerobaculia bacterium]